jgi:hypothetical protein
LTAGIPLAAQLVEEIKKKYPDEIKRLVKPEQQDDYGCCMGALALGERKELLEPHLREAKINWAHIALASLIRAEFVRRVLTFNFDSVLARACGLLARYPAIYDFGVSPSERMDYLAEPCIVHLHGQGYGPIMMNSEEETRAHAQKLRPLIDDTFSKFPLVVVGYGGESDKVFEEIVAAYAGQHRLYWLGFDEEPKARLRALLEGANKNYIHYYGGADADAIMIALAQKLDCFPPLAFSDPAAHLFEERTGIAEFPLGATDLKYDLLKESQTRLKQGGKGLKLDEIMLAALRGDSEEIVKRERATPAGEKSPVPPQISAWALISSGHAHLKKRPGRTLAGTIGIGGVGLQEGRRIGPKKSRCPLQLGRRALRSRAFEEPRGAVSRGDRQVRGRAPIETELPGSASRVGRRAWRTRAFEERRGAVSRGDRQVQGRAPIETELPGSASRVGRRAYPTRAFEERRGAVSRSDRQI